MNNPTTNHPASPAPVKADRYQPLRDALAHEHWANQQWALRSAADPDTIAALLKERDALREALIEAKTRIAAIGYPASPDGEYSKDGEWTFSDAVPRAVDAEEVKAAFLVICAALADGEASNG